MDNFSWKVDRWWTWPNQNSTFNMHAIFQCIYVYLSEKENVEYPFDVELFKRQGEENSEFGFVWYSLGTAGAIITRIIPDSPADRCDGRLQSSDIISAINGNDINGKNHSDIETLITTSGASIVLTIEGARFLIHTL